MKPANFTWIDDHLAGSAKPYQIEEIETMITDGATDLISLTPTKPLISKFLDNKIRHHHFPVYSTPDKLQISSFILLMQEIRKNNGKGVVHCEFGQERTGIFLVCYLVEILQFNLKNAITKIRSLRPNSLQMLDSIEFLENYYK